MEVLISISFVREEVQGSEKFQKVEVEFEPRYDQHQRV